MSKYTNVCTDIHVGDAVACENRNGKYNRIYGTCVALNPAERIIVVKVINDYKVYKIGSTKIELASKVGTEFGLF